MTDLARASAGPARREASGARGAPAAADLEVLRAVAAGRRPACQLELGRVGQRLLGADLTEADARALNSTYAVACRARLNGAAHAARTTDGAAHAARTDGAQAPERAT